MPVKHTKDVRGPAASATASGATDCLPLCGEGVKTLATLLIIPVDILVGFIKRHAQLADAFPFVCREWFVASVGQSVDTLTLIHQSVVLR